MLVAIGSQNPIKIEAVRTAFEKMGLTVEVISVEVVTGVSDQPFSDEETIQGAVNRAKNVFNSPGVKHVDYAIGLEGGVVETSFGVFVCNWGAVVNREGVIGIGGGHRVQLPHVIVQELHKGLELGTVIDQWAGGHGIKKKEGTIGILTDNHITRTSMFRDVVICSFSRFLNPSFYR